MASLVFGLGASAITGGATSFGAQAFVAAAGIAGSIIDNQFLFPAQAGRAQDVSRQGTRINGLQINGTSEGSPMNFVLGPDVRVAGQVIWMSDLIEEANSVTTYGPHQGGSPLKGGTRSSSSTTTSYSYFVDLAVAIAEGEVENLQQIFANGQLIYDDPTLANETSDEIDCKPYTTGSNNWLQVSASVASGITWENFTTGYEVDMTGWSDANLNDTWVIMEIGVSGVTNKPFLILANADGYQATEAAGNSINVDQATTQFGDLDVTDIRFYTGDLAQTPDPLIESYLGVGNVPAFRGTSYVVFERLAIGNFGNILPQLNFVVSEKATKTVAEGIGDIIERAGLTASDYDVSTLTPDLRGYVSVGPSSATAMLQPILQAFNLIVTQRSNALIFRERGSQDTNLVETDDLSAASRREGSTRPFVITDTFASDLPAEVNVNFREPKINLQIASQRERKVDFANDTVVTFDFPITMTEDEARTIARRILWNAHRGSQVIALQVPVSYLDIEEGDNINVVFEGEIYAFLVRKIDRGADETLNMEGTIEFVKANTQAGEGSLLNPDDFDRGLFIGGGVAFEVIDIAPFADSEYLVPGVYVACSLTDTSAIFIGAQLLKSNDSQTFFNAGNFAIESTMGSVVGLAGGGPVTVVDQATVITVQLLQGSLQTITDDAFLLGGNLAVMGDEVIQFRDATLVDTNKYEISYLLRGLRNTEDEVNNHSALDERFILMSEQGPQFVKMPVEDIGEDRFFKAVPPSVPAGTLPQLGVTPMGANTIRGFTPDFVTATRNGINDLTIRWLRRSRAISRHFDDNSKVPLLETRERYEIDILNVAATAVVRTIVVDGPFTLPDHPDQLYTADEQTTDGLSPGQPVNMIIYQMTEQKGRGKGKGATV